MVNTNPLILCVDCRGVLESGNEAFTCSVCQTRYPTVLNIPDLRSFDPPYSTRAEDLARARQVAERYNALGFADLMRFTYGTLHPEISVEKLASFVSHRIQRADLNEERWQRCQGLIERTDLRIQKGIGLDLGCGVGGLLSKLAQVMSHVVGVDIVMEELVLAHKYLAEQGVDNVTLICTDGETLPLAPGTLSLVNATNVIEHLHDPGQVLETIYTLLAPGGLFALDSPNRWDLIHPEPHVGVRFVGLWPRPLQEPYVHLVSGKEYKGKRLLSLPELRRLLRRHMPSANHLIYYWPRWHLNTQPRTRLGHVLRRHWPRLVPYLNRIWALFAGVYEVIAWKPANRVRSASSRVVPMPVNADTQAGVEVPSL